MSFEQDMPWFPGDFPGTKAGWEWELRERDKRKANWEKRPKGKRIEWDSVDLGAGRKGEIGMGWACDWERLFERLGVPSSGLGDDAGTLKVTGQGQASQPVRVSEVAQQPEGAEAPEMTKGLEGAKTSKSSKASKGARVPKDGTTAKDLAASKKAKATQTPYDLRQAFPPHLRSLSDPPSPRTLITITITLLHRGSPMACARIYRLPMSNPALHSAWLQQVLPPRRRSANHSHPRSPRNISNIKAHPSDARASLASSLLHPPISTPYISSDGIPQAGHPDYPIVPSEEDLIGFVTAGNYNLGEGRGTAIGSVALERVMREIKGGGKGGICIIREAGLGVGRIARWSLV
ncbi:MAG: hypothetical protein Q9187_007108 [Circinaria calcarea]